MPKRHTIQVPKQTYERICAIATRCDSKLYGVVAWLANGWDLLTTEQRAAAMAIADPASPSVGDASQSAKSANAKQPPTYRLPQKRRRAG